MTRSQGLSRLQGFLPSAGSRYAKTRNFDFGRDRRANVSMLSPFLRHRLVLEPEVLDVVLSAHAAPAADKFVQEVFWRAYFKGWLEHRPTVWEDYREGVRSALGEVDRDPSLEARYLQAVNGRTGIDCFDAWATELVDTGYLHNHARMWFASIWAYTLQLPWALGADFFYRNLVDGDPASNTCSWRWVCGLHTPGKTYLARASNIAKYTDGRFNPVGRLARNAPPLNDSRAHPVRSLPAARNLPRDVKFALLVTEEDCCPESLSGIDRPAAVAGVSLPGRRSPLPVGQPARDFARSAVEDALQRASGAFGCQAERIESTGAVQATVEWVRSQDIEMLATPYAPVGPVAEFLAQLEDLLRASGVHLVRVRRAYDSASWPHATRGFFRLRQSIPDILGQLGIPAREARKKAG